MIVGFWAFEVVFKDYVLRELLLLLVVHVFVAALADRTTVTMSTLQVGSSQTSIIVCYIDLTRLPSKERLRWQ